MGDWRFPSPHTAHSGRNRPHITGPVSPSYDHSGKTAGSSVVFEFSAFNGGTAGSGVFSGAGCGDVGSGEAGCGLGDAFRLAAVFTDAVRTNEVLSRASEEVFSARSCTPLRRSATLAICVNAS